MHARYGDSNILMQGVFEFVCE